MSIDTSVFGAMIAGKSQQNATALQMHALNKQRKYLFDNLNPEVINADALKYDTARAKAQLALQQELDPTLAKVRGLGQEKLLAELQNLGVKSGQVADQATAEAMTDQTKQQAGKEGLIDAALEQLRLGATLPPDVQAELVKSGLESSGMATGRSTAQGMGGTMLRTILGSAGIKLQMERQAKAESLLTSAANLEATRQNVLQNLFPRLQALQTGNMGAAAGAFGTANANLPQAGLSGNDVANIWLARVGATNALTQQAGNVQSAAALAQGNIWSSALGSAGANMGQGMDIYNRVMMNSGGGGGGGGGGSTGYVPATSAPATTGTGGSYGPG